MNPRSLRAPIAHPHSPPPPVHHATIHNVVAWSTSASSSTASFKFFSSSHKPDPDREDSVWDEPGFGCSYSQGASARSDGPTALVSLREVPRHKVPVDSPQSAQSSSITLSRMANNAASPSAWAKPAVEVNMAAVDGQVTGMPEAVVPAGRILHELDGASVLSFKGSTDSAASGFHRNERASQQDVLHTLTSLIREPRRDWRCPT
jgi:hypothetical protein